MPDSFSPRDLLASARHSRHFFLKHLVGLGAEDYAYQPFPATKSIRETLVHLIRVDRSALDSLQTGTMASWNTLEPVIAQETEGLDSAALLALLAQSHDALTRYIEERFGDADLAEPMPLWGSTLRVGEAIPHLSSEDYYHAGQVAFLRMARHPDWDYYGAVYGG